MRIAAAIAVALSIAAGARLSADAAREQREFGLFEVRLDGAGRKALLRNPEIRSVAEMSPDRTRILYMVRANLPPNESSLYSAAVDGSDVRLLATSSFLGAPTWSPDGRRIAFEAVDHTRCSRTPARCMNGDVWVVNPDGTGLRRLALYGIAPSWSPDSLRVAFAGHFNAYFQRGVVTVVGADDPGKERELSSLESQAWSDWKLSWSPRGDRIAYAVEKGGRSLVRIARLNSRRRRGARTLLAGLGPSWSPDGKRLVVWVRSSRWLYLVSADGRHRRRLGRGLDPVWSPDGRWIAFTEDSPPGCFQVFVIRPNGLDRRALTNEPCGAHFDVFWAPDGTRLIYASSVPSL